MVLRNKSFALSAKNAAKPGAKKYFHAFLHLSASVTEQISYSKGRTDALNNVIITQIDTYNIAYRREKIKSVCANSMNFLHEPLFSPQSGYFDGTAADHLIILICRIHTISAYFQRLTAK